MATSDDAALRAEHDELAKKLGVRRSIDELRAAAYAGFATVIALGLTGKVSWDRWGWIRLPKPPPKGRYPILPLLAFVLFVVLLTLTVRYVRRARVHREEEQRLIARFEELRRTLRLDP